MEKEVVKEDCEKKADQCKKVSKLETVRQKL